MENVREALRGRIAQHRHSALLAAIVAAFVVRPLMGDTGLAFAMFSAALLVLLLVALYNINIDELVGERGQLLAQSKRRLIYGWVLVTAAAVGRVTMFFERNRTLDLATTVCWLLFALFVALSLLRSVLKQKEVTSETICMAVSVYLMLGFAWALLYSAMFQVHPESFAGLVTAKPDQAREVLHVFPVLGYFSLTTLSTIGFGDITPLTLQARYAAVAEGISGQFYMAILVARLIGIQMSHAASPHPQDQPRELIIPRMG